MVNTVLLKPMPFADPDRLVLARMVLVHRVLPRDPLQADAAEDGALNALLRDPAG